MGSQTLLCHVGSLGYQSAGVVKHSNSTSKYKERESLFLQLSDGDYFGTGEMAAQFFIKRRYRKFCILWK
jgi:hypothetical protein